MSVQALPSARVMSQEDDNLSDSGHNSMSSLPPYRPPFRPHLAHIRSAAMSQLLFMMSAAIRMFFSNNIVKLEETLYCLISL